MVQGVGLRVHLEDEVGVGGGGQRAGRRLEEESGVGLIEAVERYLCRVLSGGI